jgi:WD40 repeat protein
LRLRTGEAAIGDEGLAMPESQPRNLRVVRQINRPDILFSVARLADADHLLVASSAGKVFAIDASQTNPDAQALANHGRYVTSVRVTGTLAVSGSYDGRLIWWDVAGRRPVRNVNAHSRWVRQLTVSPDGGTVASVGDDMVCRLWDTSTGALVRDLGGHAVQTPQHFTSMLYAVAFSADGRRLATGDRVGHVVVWDVATGQQLATIEAPTLYTWDGVQRIRSIGGVRALAFSPDGTHLAIGGVGQIGNVDSLAGPSRVEVFDWERRQRVLEFTGAQGMVTRLIYHPQGRWLCALGGGSNGLAMFYDTAARSMIHQANLPMHVHDATFNDEFTALYAVGHNKIAVLELQA